MSLHPFICLVSPLLQLGLLKRLHSFSLPSITTPTQSEPVPNDPIIRKLAMLSQLAVFKDIIPGYRIRALTDKEKAEKVSQQVARQREHEQGLVGVYQAYLRALEAEIKGKPLQRFVPPARLTTVQPAPNSRRSPCNQCAPCSKKSPTSTSAPTS